MVKLTVEEWKEKGKELFGTDDVKGFKFVCPQCGNVQSFDDLEGVVDSPQDYFYFSCIGRFKTGVGCDWTLGGLFQIHKTEIIDDNGDAHPCFEFAGN